MNRNDIEVLNDAILRMFDLDSLRRLLYFNLSKKLDHVASPGSFPTMVFETIETAEREGWLIDLLAEAFRSNHTDPELFALAHSYGIPLTPPPRSRRQILDLPNYAYGSESSQGGWVYTGYTSEFIGTLFVHPSDEHLIFAGTLPASKQSRKHCLYVSSDGGNYWHSLDIGARGKINDICYSRTFGLLIVASDSGLYISTDEGITWREDKIYRDSEVRAVAAPANLILCGRGKRWSGTFAGSSTVVAGTLDPEKSNCYQARSNDFEAGNLHVSIDGGKTYKTFPSLMNVNKIAFNDATPDFMLFATSDAGVLRSFDAGITIEHCAMLSARNIFSVASSPEDPHIVLAGTNGGLFWSSDAGDSWQLCEDLPTTEITDVKFSRADPQRILVTSRFGVHESRNGGRTWHESNRGLSYLWSMQVATTRANQVFVGTSGGGVYRRRDKEMKWQSISRGLEYQNQFTDLQICEGGLLFGATGTVVCRSQNRGATWEPIGYFHDRFGLLDHAWSVACVPESSQTTLKKESDFSISVDGASTWQSPSELRAKAICVGTYWGNIYTSFDNGVSWKESLANNAASRWSAKTGRVTRIAYHEKTRRLLAANATAGLFISLDSGKSWEEIPLGDDEAHPISLCWSKSGRCYLGTSDGKVFESDDNGEAWKLLFELSTTQTIRNIACRDSQLLLACEHDQVAIYDLGKDMLSHLNRGLEGVEVTTVVPHPSRPSTLFAGTESGVFVSNDPSFEWEQLFSGVNSPQIVGNLKFLGDEPPTLYACASNGLFSLRSHNF